MFAFRFVIAKLHDLQYNLSKIVWRRGKEFVDLSSWCHLYSKLSILCFALNRVETKTCLKTSFKPTNQNIKQFMSNKFTHGCSLGENAWYFLVEGLFMISLAKSRTLLWKNPKKLGKKQGSVRYFSYRVKRSWVFFLVVYGVSWNFQPRRYVG